MTTPGRTGHRLVRFVTASLAIAVVAAALTGCSHAGRKKLLNAPAGPSPFSSPDPAPKQISKGNPIGPTGGTYTAGNVSLTVPAGAVPVGTTITPETAPATGAVAAEIFGQPLGVEHTSPLTKPLHLTWHTSGLSPAQLSSAVLTKWDATTKTWQLSPIRLTVTGTTLSADVQTFSTYDWVANVGQKVGEWTSTRADAPTCNKNALPSWVQGVVNTADDTKAAATLSCVEPDSKQPNVVAVKVVDNRTFAQQLKLSGGNNQWSWTAPGNEDYGSSGVVYDVARRIFDNATTLLVPPLGTVAFGIARPTYPGASILTAAKAVENGQTVLVDLTAWAFGKLDVGGSDNPLTNAFLQAGFDCGGTRLLAQRPSGTRQLVQFVVGTIADCAGELHDPSSEFGAEFQKLALTAIAHSAKNTSKDKTAKMYRLIDEAGSSMALLSAGDVAFYLSDQLANSLVGPMTLSIRGRGTPQQLGTWTPACKNLTADSNALYRNLGLQDTFSDTSRAFWQYPEFQPDAASAVQPVMLCDYNYRHELADAQNQGWADPQSGGIVAAAIRALDTPAVATPVPTTTPQPSTPQSRPTSSVTCAQFSVMTDSQQRQAVQTMLQQLHSTQWGVDEVLPNVRAMCLSYPANTPISATMTGG